MNFSKTVDHLSITVLLTSPLFITQKGKKCQRTTRPQKPMQITFAGCITARRYRPRSCGSCSDGHFCVPSLTRTVRLHFHCPGPEQEDFTRNVMWIQRCNCSQRNNQPGLFSQTELLNLPNDIHIYTHWWLKNMHIFKHLYGCSPSFQQYQTSFHNNMYIPYYITLIIYFYVVSGSNREDILIQSR